MRRFSLALSLAVFGTASAAQPFSTSMAQCAALMQNAAQWVEADDNAEQLMQATRDWHRAAVARARSEGIPNAEARITALMDQQTATWEAEGAGFFYTQEFRDWAAYCRKFGQAQHVGANR